MPEVPITSPTIGLRNTNPSLSQNTGRGAFGEDIAAAAQRAGGVLGQVGRAVGAEELRQLQSRSNADTLDAWNRFQEGLRPVRSEFHENRRGKKAEDVTKDFGAVYDEASSKIAADLAPAARRGFEQLVARKRETEMGSMKTFEVRQGEIYRKTTSDASIAHEQQNMVDFHQSPEEQFNSINKINQMVATEGEFQGLDKKTIALQQEAARTKGVVESVGASLAYEDIESAERTLLNFKKSIDPKAAADLRKRIDAAKDNKTIEGMAAKHLPPRDLQSAISQTDGGSAQAIVDLYDSGIQGLLDEDLDPAMQRQAMDIMDTQRKLALQQLSEKQSTSYAQALKEIESAETATGMHNILRNSEGLMSGTQVSALRNRIAALTAEAPVKENADNILLVGRASQWIDTETKNGKRLTDSNIREFMDGSGIPYTAAQFEEVIKHWRSGGEGVSMDSFVESYNLSGVATEVLTSDQVVEDPALSKLYRYVRSQVTFNKDASSNNLIDLITQGAREIYFPDRIKDRDATFAEAVFADEQEKFLFNTTKAQQEVAKEAWLKAGRSTEGLTEADYDIIYTFMLDNDNDIPAEGQLHSNKEKVPDHIKSPFSTPSSPARSDARE